MRARSGRSAIAGSSPGGRVDLRPRWRGDAASGGPSGRGPCDGSPCRRASRLRSPTICASFGEDTEERELLLFFFPFPFPFPLFLFNPPAGFRLFLPLEAKESSNAGDLRAFDLVLAGELGVKVLSILVFLIQVKLDVPLFLEAELFRVAQSQVPVLSLANGPLLVHR